ncbi:MAG: hypothetical protein JSV92_02765, partial [archaeon]
IQEIDENGMRVGKGSISSYMPFDENAYNVLKDAKVGPGHKVYAYFKSSNAPDYLRSADQLAAVRIIDENIGKDN